MSFIRKKLSRVWNRSSEESSCSSREIYRTSISSEDTRYSSNTVPSLLGSIKEASQGRLHKAASTTFQAFSDSIRAKTRIFYSNPTQLESAGQGSPEPKLSRKHGQRGLIWFSTDSCQGLPDRNNQCSAADSLGTPTALPFRPAEPAPALDVKIPGSSLTDLRGCVGSIAEPSKIASENQAIGKEHYSSKQSWPSPVHIECPQLPTVRGLSSPVMQSSSMDDPYTEPSCQFTQDSAMPDSCHSTSDTSEHLGKKDEGYRSDFRSVADHMEPNGLSPSNIAPRSYFIPLTAPVVKSPPSGNSSFVENNQAGARFQRTPSPLQKPKQNQESCFAGAVFRDSMSDPYLESPLTVVRSDLSIRDFYKEHTQTEGWLGSSDGPLARRSNGTERMLDAFYSDPTGLEAVERFGYGRLPSYTYQGDAESAASTSNSPSMGSRHTWNETRADRNDRYLAIHTLSEVTYSDEESGSELVLSKLPRTKRVRSSGKDDRGSLSGSVQKTKPSVPEHANTETRTLESRNVSLQKKLEALELLESSCEASTDPESQVSDSPRLPLRFSVEAIDRVCGPVLDELETPTSALPGETSLYSDQHIDDVPDSILAELDPYIFHYPGRAAAVKYDVGGMSLAAWHLPIFDSPGLMTTAENDASNIALAEMNHLSGLSTTVENRSIDTAFADLDSDVCDYPGPATAMKYDTSGTSPAAWHLPIFDCPGLATFVENDSRVEREAFERPASNFSGHHGGQPFVDTQEVTKTASDNEESEDAIQRSNKLDRLLLAHHRSFQKRIHDRRSRKEMFNASEEDVLTHSSQDAETLFSVPNMSKESFSNTSARVPPPPNNDEQPHLCLDDEFWGGNEILDITVMEGEKSPSCDLANDASGSSPRPELQPADRASSTNSLASIGLARRSLKKGEMFRGNPPNTPVESSRSVSTESIRTTDSCAVTTSSPVCYAPPPFPTLHVRSGPALRTTSIIAGLDSQNGPSDEDLWRDSPADAHTSTPEILETLVRERHLLDNVSSPSKPGPTKASATSAATAPSPTAGTKAQSALKEHLESPASPRLFEHDSTKASPNPAAPLPSPLGSAQTKKCRKQALPFTFEDRNAELSTEEAGGTSIKGVSLIDEPNALGETTGNKGKKKRKNKKNKKSKKGDTILVKSKSAISSPLREALGLMPLDMNSRTNLHPTKGEYQTSSHKKGIWWARDKAVVGQDGSPLAGKVLENGVSGDTCVESGDEGRGRNSEKDGNEKENAGVGVMDGGMRVG